MKRPHRLLAAVPPAVMLVGVPFANHVRPYVFGLPFLLFFFVACVLLTSVALACVGWLDRRADARDAAEPSCGSPAPPAPPAP